MRKIQRFVHAYFLEYEKWGLGWGVRRMWEVEWGDGAARAASVEQVFTTLQCVSANMLFLCYAAG